MFIRIQNIAKQEWHPFTISSATELKDELWVHVRSLGTWTNRLNDYFSEEARKEESILRKGYELGKKEGRFMTRNQFLSKFK